MNIIISCFIGLIIGLVVGLIHLFWAESKEDDFDKKIIEIEKELK